MPKLKGKKVYGVATERDSMHGHYATIEEATRRLDLNWPYLVELTVTKVYTRERELREIETE